MSRDLWTLATALISRYMIGVSQNRVYTPYMAVYLAISLPHIPYMHRLCMVLVNSTHDSCVSIYGGVLVAVRYKHMFLLA